MKATAWRDRGQLYTVGKYRLFAIDTGGDGPVLAILHGYPTSSYDYVRALPILAERFRVVVHDHLGFGFSDKPRQYSYSLIEQADHAVALWRQLGITTAHILAHDYGTSVATELVARRNFASEPVTMETLTLCNGSMHIELAELRPMQRLLRSPFFGPLVARLASERLFGRNLRQVVADPACLDDEDLAAMWQQLMAGDGRAVLAKVSRYIDERYRFWHRWIGALRQTDLPVSIVWARNDPVAVEKIAEVLHDEIAGSRLELLDGLGHFPMIEDPARWSAAVLQGIEEVAGRNRADHGGEPDNPPA